MEKKRKEGERRQEFGVVKGRDKSRAGCREEETEGNSAPYPVTWLLRRQRRW